MADALGREFCSQQRTKRASHGEHSGARVFCNSDHNELSMVDALGPECSVYNSTQNELDVANGLGRESSARNTT